MIFLLPVILTLLVLGAMRGGTSMMLLLPTILFLGAGAVAVTIAQRDARARRSRSVTDLRTDHLSRKMRSALAPEGSQRPRRSSGKAASLSARGPGRRPDWPRRLPD